MNIFYDLGLASGLIVLTGMIHAIILDRIMVFIQPHLHKAQGERISKHEWKILLGVFAVLGIFFSHTIHIWLWAFTYLALEIPVLTSLQDAIYFSTVTYTTVGYGDIVFKGDWRVLSSIEAANGIIMLGWSTAFLFEVMSLLYPRKPLTK